MIVHLRHLHRHAALNLNAPLDAQRWRGVQDRLGELKEQLKRAVRPDSQLRVFYCGTYPEAPLPNLLEGPVDVGLVFTCTRGTVDLHEGGICGKLPLPLRLIDHHCRFICHDSFELIFFSSYFKMLPVCLFTHEAHAVCSPEST